MLGPLEESKVRGKALILISHDLAVVSRIADVDFPESDSPTPRVSPDRSSHIGVRLWGFLVQDLRDVCGPWARL